MTDYNHIDHLDETGFLLDVLRDAVCNADVNENCADRYWVLIDLIGERIKTIREMLAGGEGGM